MVVEWTSYRPNEGCFDAVLATRREACAIRQRIGLEPGRVHVAEGEQGKMVYWCCAFASQEEQDADLAARGASAEFEAIRERMRQLIRHFERTVLRDVGANVGVLRDVPVSGTRVRPRELGFVSEGRDLKGYLFVPPGDGPFPCMITSHGSTIHQGTSDVCRPGSAALLLSWGIASFLPHRHGYGNSPGPAWREDASAEIGSDAYDEQVTARLERESRDVVAALEFVETLREIDSGHIGVMGSSFGGTVTLLAAAATGRFRCAVDFAGAAMNWERAQRLREKMFSAAARLTQPVLFLQAANDYSVRPTEELAASLASKDVVVESRIYPDFGLTRDEGHWLYGDGGLVWGPDVRRFLERWL